MNHGSLFSGIGGFDLAAEWMGWNNMFHCEINPFCQQVLKHYWPNAECYDDIKKTDFTKWRGTIDIVSGGFPCQPYSHAGQRKGKDDDRHLWPEMLRAIREIEPSYIVGENVRGLISWNEGMVFDEVQTDLELAGYEVAAVVIPAAGVNAPHGRDRVWFVAYSDRNARQRRHRQSGCEESKTNRDGKPTVHIGVESTSQTGIVTDTQYNTPPTNGGTIESPSREIRGNNTGDVFGGFCDDGDVANTECIGLHIGTDTRKIRGNETTVGGKRCESANAFETNGTKSNVTNTSGTGLQGNKFHGTPAGGKWKQNESRSTTPEFYQIGNWQQFPTQPPICGGNDGLPTQLDGITFPKWRNESIKGYGNAVVPQVVYQIFKCLMNLESKSNA